MEPEERHTAVNTHLRVRSDRIIATVFILVLDQVSRLSRNVTVTFDQSVKPKPKHVKKFGILLYYFGQAFF